MTKTKVKTLIILDRSGSMRGQEQDVIGGFNELVDKLIKDEGIDVDVSLVQFDTSYEEITWDTPAKLVPLLTKEVYYPRGGTAMLDAIGHYVNKFRAYVEEGQRAIVTIFTDGMENSSKEWTLDQVKDLIKTLDEDVNWEFNFLGADPTVAHAGANYNFARGQNVNYGGDVRSAFLAKAAFMVETPTAGGVRGQSMAETYNRVTGRDGSVDNQDTEDNED